MTIIAQDNTTVSCRARTYSVRMGRRIRWPTACCTGRRGSSPIGAAASGKRHTSSQACTAGRGSDIAFSGGSRCPGAPILPL